MDTHLSTVSNRLNVVMKQLTIIATVFLPLIHHGIFRAELHLLVVHITGAALFWGLGVGSMLATCVGLLVFFHRKGWV